MEREGAERSLVGTRVLLVEDTADIREVFATLLTLEGAKVLTVATARDALDLLRRQGFDILLTDLGLPDIPGHVLIEHVVAMVPRRPRIVVVTGYGDPYASEARRAGADAVLTKPVPWSRLRAQLISVSAAPVIAA